MTIEQSADKLRWYGKLGLLIVIVAEVLLFYGNTFVGRWFTPLVWSGYILFLDSVIYQKKGRSLLVNRTGDFLVMLPLSIFLWVVFEGYNLFIDNWHYINLPENLAIRYFAYAWAFATIWPAIFLTTEWLETTLFCKTDTGQPLFLSSRWHYTFLLFGLFCLILPLVYPSRYLAAPVWMGFVFFLDPINYRLGLPSLLKKFEKGRPQRFYALLLAGLICGILWEFWNYWATAKWQYTIPILKELKIFEMPLPGYFGFPVFALECYTMYYFTRGIIQRRDDELW